MADTGDSYDVHCRARSYGVSVWPDDRCDNIDAITWCVSVSWRGHGRWAVVRGVSDGGPVLGRDGTWSYEEIPSSREDDWLAAHRFTLEEAMALAAQWAPKVTVNGMTALEVLQRHRERFPDGEKVPGA